MNIKEMAKTVADTIIWMAQERIKTEPFPNINAAVVAIGLEIDRFILDFMDKHKNEGR